MLDYNFTPFNEEQLKNAVKRLAYFFASDMGWVHKNISSKRDLTEEKNIGEVKDNE